MNANRFKEIETRFHELRTQMEEGGINADAYKQELKKLMLQDDQGRYWMIGGKSGSWYVYDNNEWRTANPYEEPEGGQEEAAYETREAAAETVEKRQASEPAPAREREPVSREKLSERHEMHEEVPCKFCASKIPVHAQFCPICGGNQKTLPKEKKAVVGEAGQVEIKAIRVLSLIFFLGGVGIILGVLAGAIFGSVFSAGGDLIFQFPQILQETKGKVQGGLIFGALGGIAGFILFAASAALLSLFYNFVAFIFGGVRLKTKT